MSTLYTPTATWNSTITVPEDADDILATTVASPTSALADNTEYLRSRTPLAMMDLIELSASVGSWTDIIGYGDTDWRGIAYSSAFPDILEGDRVHGVYMVELGIASTIAESVDFCVAVSSGLFVAGDIVALKEHVVYEESIYSGGRQVYHLSIPFYYEASATRSSTYFWIGTRNASVNATAVGMYGCYTLSGNIWRPE